MYDNHVSSSFSSYYYYILSLCSVTLQLHIIHQRPGIMIVYAMTSEVIQNNLISIIRFHGIDIPILFQWGCQ